MSTHTAAKMIVAIGQIVNVRTDNWIIDRHFIELFKLKGGN